MLAHLPPFFLFNTAYGRGFNRYNIHNIIYRRDDAYGRGQGGSKKISKLAKAEVDFLHMLASLLFLFCVWHSLIFLFFEFYAQNPET